jgi:hypothetical protein
LAVDGDGRRLALRARHADGERGDARLDRRQLGLRRDLRVEERGRRLGGNVFPDDLRIRLAGEHELPELRPRPRDEKQVRRCVHQRLRAREKIDRVAPALLVEGLRAFGGHRARTRAILVALRPCRPKPAREHEPRYDRCIPQDPSAHPRENTPVRPPSETPVLLLDHSRAPVRMAATFPSRG